MLLIFQRLIDEESIMGINNDPNNSHIPSVKATAVLLICKHWIPNLERYQDVAVINNLLSLI